MSNTKAAVPPPLLVSAMKGEVWEFEYLANLLFGANPRPILVNYEPGNSTSYTLLIIPSAALCKIGSDKSFGPEECIVTWLGNSKSYIFTLDRVSTGYLAGKLDLNHADAAQITLFLNRIATTWKIT